ncbi:MAG TPA: peptidyl-alpha-hydroxyglycine alpha-amidating lyase family protein [Rhizomicrobium sp.]|nr:peptidyl-alpha-hydroxyglycine alpha-amidating lyase family protein [Rhizomicrobium sp.]
MKSIKTLLLAAACVIAAPALAQELNYTTSQPLMLPADTFFGSVFGVATNSKGHVFVYTRNGDPVMTLAGSRAFARGGSSLYEFGPDGKFIRQIGKQNYGFLAAQQVRVDKDDNVWVVDRYSNMVIKFNPQGQVAMTLGRKPEALVVPAPAETGRGDPPGSGVQADIFQSPTDVAFDANGNIFVADGIGNARVAKFTGDGVFVKSWGSRGTASNQFQTAHGIAVDNQGNVYVGDRGNRRIQVFDNDGNFKSSITTGGDPQAICMSPGPHQYLFSSNSNPPEDFDQGGEIYKLELNGTVVGKFGQVGKGPKDFGTVNSIDCRDPSSLYVGEAANWRVTKVTLR